MSERPAIEATGLVKAYEEGRIRALNGMGLVVGRGELVAVAGPSGCGKSTLLHLVAALDRPDAGTLVVDGHDLARERDLSHYRARHVGIVFQLHNLLPSLSAEENVQVPMFELGVRGRERRLRAAALLAAVGLEGRARNRPAQLSGGERQRVAIARALANEPAILLADEPTGSLDSAAGAQVLDLLERVREERGATLVLVTHDDGVAARADRVVRMLDGRAVEAAGAASPAAPARAAAAAR
jgi:putative ABC transport system ATP-binding protein